MRVLIDTNVLISAALSANGTPFQAYVKAASYPNHGLICEQNVDEMKRIFNKKFPHRLAALDKFLSEALLTLELVPIPTDEKVSETQNRDINDRPILRAAIEAKADVLLTGDQDFWDLLTQTAPHFSGSGALFGISEPALVNRPSASRRRGGPRCRRSCPASCGPGSEWSWGNCPGCA